MIKVEGLSKAYGGFLAVDAHARIPGVPDVFAAGDVTAGPVKQGGLAAQQADAAALWIAAEAGAPVDPAPPAPVLRAVMYTPDGALHLRAPLDDPRDGEVSPTPLWHPPGKVAGRFLAGFLADRGWDADRVADHLVRHGSRRLRSLAGDPGLAVAASPGGLQVVVSGGAGVKMQLLPGWTGGTRSVTVPVAAW